MDKLMTQSGQESEWMADLVPTYQAMGIDQLRTELAQRVAGTVENIRHMACIVRVLEEKGVDLSEIRTPWLADLRRVAYGQLLPGVVVAGTRDRKLIDVARMLPLPEQERIARDEPMPVVVMRPGVGPEPRFLPPSKMERWMIKQVFAPGKIRTEVEQVNYLDNPKRRPKTYGPNIVLDKRRKCIVVNGEGVTVTAAQMAEFLRELTKE